MEEKYKTKRPIDGKKPIWVIVNEDGKVVNKNPSKEELKGLEKEPRKPYDTRKKYKKYTDEQLLLYLIQFYEKYGRPPTETDFTNNPEYPNFSTYQERFGSWSNALKLVGLDVESMVKKGIVETTNQKARLGEMIVRDHFKNHPIDLAGENCNSSCDGICPNGKIYDVKSSVLYMEYKYYSFNTRNKYKEEIEIYYLLGFNEDYTKLEYGWRIPGEIIEGNHFYIGSTHRSEFNVKNMKQYDITNILRHILKNIDFIK